MALPRTVAEGWVNLEYARGTNEQYPNLNPDAPGRPYFVDDANGVPGQWVRLVFRKRSSKRTDVGDFWCVGRLVERSSDGEWRFGHAAVEGGNAPAAVSGKRFRGSIRAQDGQWIVTEFEREPSDLAAELVRTVREAKTMGEAAAALAALEAAGIARPEDEAVVVAALLSEESSEVTWALEVVERQVAAGKRWEHPALLKARLTRVATLIEDEALEDRARRAARSFSP